VNHLHEGLKIALHEDREKNSTILGASSVWRGDSSITKLPPVLTVQFMRFFWKTNVTSEGGAQGNNNIDNNNTRSCNFKI
jgi:ubiquitin carboxyl-terminal hydrolase 14